MTKLDLGGLRLPADAITQTFGVLAVRGAGKSNLAAVMAEEMFSAGLPFVVIDPVGAWYGLRSAGNGQGPGLSVVILGGKHGDVPLEKAAGAMVADLIVDERLSAVLDVSEFSKTDRIRFLTDLAERLYRRNQDPLHLFLEEADDFIPQKPFREEARCLAAWETIVRRGRAKGLGITMVTQRSAAINKNVLTQIETLFVLRITAPQDRKAIAAWVEYQGQAGELLESLAGLEAGEAWVWSPQWLKTMKRVRIRRRATFDSGATPKDVRGRRKPATLADVDLGAVRDAMAATIERAKAEDPKALRTQLAAAQGSVRRLEGELAAAKAATPPAPAPTTVPVLTPDAVAAIEGAADKAVSLARDLQAMASSIFTEAKTALEQLRSVPARPVWPDQPLHLPGARPIPVPARPRPAKAAAPGVTAAQQRLLNALAWLEAVGIAPADKIQVALFANLTPGAGHTNNSYGGLRSAGLIEYPTAGSAILTDAGRGAADPGDVPQSSEAMQQQVLERLPKAQRELLRVVIASYPRPRAKDDVATVAGLTPGAGHTNNNYGRLRSLGLIDYPSPGLVVARPVLFLEGSA